MLTAHLRLHLRLSPPISINIHRSPAISAYPPISAYLRLSSAYLRLYLRRSRLRAPHAIQRDGWAADPRQQHRGAHALRRFRQVR